MKANNEIVLKWFAEHKLTPVAEHRFDPERRWRFDYAWPDAKVALEVQGGLFNGGRHSRGPALLKEHEKLNAAACAGWRILYTIPRDLCTKDVIEMIKRAIKC
jgi:hypothetical protein